MIGAIAGDIIGSVYEWHNNKTTDFSLMNEASFFTDDSVLTIALADSILNGAPYNTLLKEYYTLYPNAGYGGMFSRWASSDKSEPYNSFGNGAAMRISPVGFAFSTLDSVMAKAEEYTAVTHDHPEGIKGAQATAAAIYLARTGNDKEQIRGFIQMRFGYDLSRRLDDIRPGYKFDETCQGTVPEAIIAFLESKSYENAIRLAISLGGDSDTLACITGGIAQAFYGSIPEEIEKMVYQKLDTKLGNITRRFMKKFIDHAS
jgi:ADP-ribosylglycohydrolase